VPRVKYRVESIEHGVYSVVCRVLRIQCRMSVEHSV